MWVPAEEGGMMNEAVNVPVSDEVTVGGVVDRTAESNITVIGELVR